MISTNALYSHVSYPYHDTESVKKYDTESVEKEVNAAQSEHLDDSSSPNIIPYIDNDIGVIGPLYRNTRH